MPRLPARNTNAPKRGWTARPAAARKKNIQPKERLTLKERLKQKSDITKRSGRNRRFIFAKDIQYLLSYSERQAYRVLKRVRTANKKSAKARVTIEEFCTCLSLSIDQVRVILED